MQSCRFTCCVSHDECGSGKLSWMMQSNTARSHASALALVLLTSCCDGLTVFKATTRPQRASTQLGLFDWLSSPQKEDDLSVEAAAAFDAQHGASTGAEGAPSTAHRAWQADYAAAAVELDYWLRCLHAGASICRAVPAVDPNVEAVSDEHAHEHASAHHGAPLGPNMEDESDEHAHEYAPAALHGAALGELLARHRRPSALRILMVNEQVPLHAC